MKSKITVDSMSMIHWWVEVSYSAYDDCRGHSGAMMSLERGKVTILSRKQKINLTSLTEVKLSGY